MRAIERLFSDKITEVASTQAPSPAGPYSQGLLKDRMLFCSGQIALDASTGMIVSGGIEAQTNRVLLNLRSVLRAADMDFENVLRTTVYLIDINDFDAMNAVYMQHLGSFRPTRTTVAVSALPRGSSIEIDAIASR